MIQKDITLSSPPHIRSNENTGRIMWLVCLALLPAALGGIYFFGIKTLPLFLSKTRHEKYRQKADDRFPETC